MLFSSLTFLFLFLPASLLIFFLVPLKYRNYALFAISLIFYGWRAEDRWYLILLILTFSLDYVAALLISKYKAKENAKAGKIVFIIALCLNIGILAFFKYTDFILVNLARIPLFSGLKPLGLAFPLGISFYSFQAMSYLIDVYLGKIRIQKNYFVFGTYVVLYPQLVAGPIIQYREIESQLSDHPSSVALAASGIRTFICGLGKKVLLANVAGELWTSIHNLPSEQMTTLLAWFGLFLFAMQIYFDFSGYSDMAIGLGKIMGFRFPENFNYPYIAQSVTDFWRRWHITLSGWFRDYVYIPFGGNRAGYARTFLNMFVVWCLTGLWHGAAWNFILWGLYYFVLLSIERLGFGKILEKWPEFFRHVYALFFILLGWLIFAFDGSSEALTFPALGRYFGYLIGIGTSGFASGLTAYELVRNLTFSFILLFACVPGPKRWMQRMKERYKIAPYLFDLGAVAVLVLCVAFLADSGFNPFLYWKF